MALELWGAEHIRGLILKSASLIDAVFFLFFFLGYLLRIVYVTVAVWPDGRIDCQWTEALRLLRRDRAAT